MNLIKQKVEYIVQKWIRLKKRSLDSRFSCPTFLHIGSMFKWKLPNRAEPTKGKKSYIFIYCTPLELYVIDLNFFTTGFRKFGVRVWPSKQEGFGFGLRRWTTWHLQMYKRCMRKPFFVVIQIWLVGAGIKLGSATEKWASTVERKSTSGLCSSSLMQVVRKCRTLKLTWHKIDLNSHDPCMYRYLQHKYI